MVRRIVEAILTPFVVLAIWLMNEPLHAEVK